ncbi:pseudaminic acid cytidylyltransferase [Arthrobacter sp. V4I6]|uniref:pseudaminic acid cytidylyltransferase n=1 Tax=unclassified Arthrobacter TaxID=235627 RepID=UPI00278AF782|nr:MULTISPECIES: pseudaminic acid cytidylyltransferase [unclassified Arthrobacter]MDQ0820507.1 pseudaminic acid cytidylyltransferase [Arthrobacter sp. V1I7]MDQ0854687.1 pseudaminic acid cytidylyltransferase [Arthrobacter sp. V4I6]
MTTCVIPARGGSKRIPRKNIREFAGKPLVSWSIEAAQEAEIFDRVVVSTDDAEVADIAREAGAEVPFVRPREYSNDFAGTIPVIAHAIDALGVKSGLVCCLYATAAFVQASDLIAGRDCLIASPEAEYSVAVTTFDFPIQRALKSHADGRLRLFSPEYENARSQDLEEAWHDAGQFYWGRARAWSEELPIFGSGAVPVALPRHRVQDIDTLEDWERAEWMFKAFKKWDV